MRRFDPSSRLKGTRAGDSHYRRAACEMSSCHFGLNIPEECFQNFFKTLEELKQFGMQKKVQPLTN